VRWESLVPVEDGRHCEACRKTVIDVERLSAAEFEVTAIHREVQSRSNASLDRAALAVTVGGLEWTMREELVASPPVPDFDLTAMASDPTGMASEDTVMLGGIGESWAGIEEPPLPVLEVELD
jgi:hypothetical protein